jgi:hypothetical protein
LVVKLLIENIFIERLGFGSGKKEAMTCQWAVSYFGKVIFTEFNIPPLIMNNALEPARPGA